MFRSPADVTSTSDTTSSSNEDTDSPVNDDLRRTLSGASANAVGSALGSQETASESIEGDRLGSTENGASWTPVSQNDHAHLMTASLLEFMYNQKAAEHLNEENGVTTYNRHSPEAKERGRLMYEQASQSLSQAGFAAGQAATEQYRETRQQYVTALEQLGTARLEAPATAFDANSGTNFDNGRLRPIPHRVVSGLLVGSGSGSPDSIGGHPSLPRKSFRYPPSFLSRSTGPLVPSESNLSSKLSFSRPPTRYEADFQEVKILGRGGYGTVYHVVNYVDNQHYAIKKIQLNARKFKKFRQGGKEEVDNILNEIRTLARLDHCNVVRYNTAWYEWEDFSVRPVTPRPNGRPRTSNKSSSPLTVRNNPGQAVAGDHIIFEVSEDDEASKGKIEEISDSNDIVFGEDSVSQGYNSRERRVSQATTRSSQSRKSHVQSTGSDNEDGEVEFIPRQSSPSQEQTSTLGFANSDSIFTDGNDAPRSRVARTDHPPTGPTITLFIQMALHPMSLSTYIQTTTPVPPPSSSATATTEDLQHRHCHHTLPSLKILSTILSGVEYLHSQGILHRDLKPANIFLSFPSSTSGGGTIEVLSCCPECSFTKTPRYLTPRIGDFGLVADLVTEVSTSSTTSSASTVPSSALTLSPPRTKRVGTEFYRPAPTMHLSEKLDVFALGVITFEMMYPFSTRMERMMILSKLTSEAVLPDRFPCDMSESEEVTNGVRTLVQGMLDPDEERRFGVVEVRSRLRSLLGLFGDAGQI